MINMRKVSMENRLQNIVTMEQYNINPELYGPGNTVIDMKNGYLLPVISNASYERGDIGIAVNTNNFISYFNMPNGNKKELYTEEYNINHGNIVDFSDCKNYHGVISKQKAIKELQSELLTNGDNISQYKISDNDTPLMAGIKEAINCKECDINLYEPNFDGNFQNDIRILNGNSITAAKAVKFGDALDMKMTVIIEDKDPSVPNPIGKKIVKVLTGED